MFLASEEELISQPSDTRLQSSFSHIPVRNRRALQQKCAVQTVADSTQLFPLFNGRFCRFRDLPLFINSCG